MPDDKRDEIGVKKKGIFAHRNKRASSFGASVSAIRGHFHGS